MNSSRRWRALLLGMSLALLGVLLSVRRSEAPADRSAGPACAGVVAPEASRRVVGRYGRGIFNCRSNRAPSFAGTLTLTLRVEPSGAVSRVSVEGADEMVALRDCVAQQAQTWRFDPMPACAVVAVPFVFRGPATEVNHPQANPACAGRVGPDSYASALPGWQAELERCLAQLPPGHGPAALNLTLEVDMRGEPQTVSLASQIFEPDFVQCAHEAARGWHFPPAPNEPCRVARLHFTLPPDPV